MPFKCPVGSHTLNVIPHSTRVDKKPPEKGIKTRACRGSGMADV